MSIPHMMSQKTIIKYGIFTYDSIAVSESSGTACMIPSAFCPKKGRKRNIDTLQSSNPKTKSRKWVSFLLLSSSAMVSASSLDNNSSSDTEKYFEIAFKESIFGYPRPVSLS